MDAAVKWSFLMTGDFLHFKTTERSCLLENFACKKRWLCRTVWADLAVADVLSVFEQHSLLLGQCASEFAIALVDEPDNYVGFQVLWIDL